MSRVIVLSPSFATCATRVEGTNNKCNGPYPLRWHPRRPPLFYLCCPSGKGGGQGSRPRGRALHRSELEGWAMRDEEEKGKEEGWGRRERRGSKGDDPTYDGSRRQQATSLTVGTRGGEGGDDNDRRLLWRGRSIFIELAKKDCPKGKNKFGGNLVKA
ncbi:hypothetical protein C4D60_Mb05t11540 [Musa balbisiana]|uniref:Uncharacterized protein n=1 Tax=Musa balbisiana TaxID=52838 RepID=A0A4S8JVF0_MUSBA|nr:hypothetical protein C4D60_Mb05t11540 [Musa balbisiana]